MLMSLGSQSPSPRRHFLPNKSWFQLESGGVYRHTQAQMHKCFLESCSSPVNESGVLAVFPGLLLQSNPFPTFLQSHSRVPSSRQAAGVLLQGEETPLHFLSVSCASQLGLAPCPGSFWGTASCCQLSHSPDQAFLVRNILFSQPLPQCVPSSTQTWLASSLPFICGLPQFCCN